MFAQFSVTTPAEKENTCTHSHTYMHPQTQTHTDTHILPTHTLRIDACRCVYTNTHTNEQQQKFRNNQIKSQSKKTTDWKKIQRSITVRHVVSCILFWIWFLFCLKSLFSSVFKLTLDIIFLHPSWPCAAWWWHWVEQCHWAWCHVMPAKLLLRQATSVSCQRLMRTWSDHAAAGISAHCAPLQETATSPSDSQHLKPSQSILQHPSSRQSTLQHLNPSQYTWTQDNLHHNT